MPDKVNNQPTQKKSWCKLEQHAAQIQSRTIQQMFAQDSERHNNLSVEIDGLFADFSKQHISAETIDLLVDLVKECHLEDKREAMFSGQILNPTENRSVLHTALRAPQSKKLTIGNTDITEQIHKTLKKIKTFSDGIRNGALLGATGKPLTHVISIGVGGSDLGTRMVSVALKESRAPVSVDFVANIDPYDLERALTNSDPETTLFIVTSKSFGTQETLTNAKTARSWLENTLPKGANYEQHFIAVTANNKAAEEFGIKADNIFPMWEWVNGRFSVWSAVGLPIAIQCGFDVFEQFLSGAHAMDEHFCSTPLHQNIPVLLGLVAVWNRNFLDHATLAIIPYSQRLRYFPATIQQLEMESNGKTIDLDGNLIFDYHTAPIIFGDVGTNGQHSFFQQLHQGSTITPCDFIGFKEKRGDEHSYTMLMNNMLAQGQAMMNGQQEVSEKEPYRYFAGNRPNTSLLFDRLDAFHLGMLLALYEHKCFVEGIIWNINSFDQFGVELGKTLSKRLDLNDLSELDSSTNNLYSRIHND